MKIKYLVLILIINSIGIINDEIKDIEIYSSSTCLHWCNCSEIPVSNTWSKIK